MPATVPLTLVANGSGTLSILNNIVTAASFRTRNTDGYALKDEGIDAIVSGYHYRNIFTFSGLGSAQVLMLIMTAKTNAEGHAQFINAPDASLIWVESSNMWSILHFSGPSAFQRVDSSFTLTLGNEYAMDKIRAGQNIIGNLYDLGGAHGVPGAQVDTLTLVPAQPLLDHQFVYGINGFNDAAVASDVSGNFTLLDMNADGRVTNPLKSAMFGDRGFIAG